MSFRVKSRRATLFSAVLVTAGVLAPVSGGLVPGSGDAALAEGPGFAPVVQDKVVSANPADWTPHVLDGRVNAIVQTGNTVILGGEFTKVANASRATTYPRSNIVAVNATTGAILSGFAPEMDGQVTALALAADGKSVYVGGAFNNVNGKASRSLTRLNVADGNATAGFTVPAVTGVVKDLKLQGNRLWLSGLFTHVAGKAQPVLATINASTGAFDPYTRLVFSEPLFRGDPQVIKFDLTPDGKKLFAIGNFSKVNGQSRPQVAMIDTSGTSAVLGNWQTNFYSVPHCSTSYDSYMRDMDISPDGKYVVITTTGGWGGNTSPCDTTARYETGNTGTGLKATWVNYSGGDTMYAVEITGPVIYLGGHFRWQNNPNTLDGDSGGPGSLSRLGIAALDPVNGLPFRWNPKRLDTGVGVFDILATPQGIWIGNDTERIGGEIHARVAFFPLDGGTVVPRPSSGTLPGTVQLTKTSGSTVSPIKRYYNGSTFGADTTAVTGNVAWAEARHGFMLSGWLYLGQSSGKFTKRTYTGSAYGSPITVRAADNVVVDSAWHNDVARATAMARASGRIYYTLPSDRNLYYRYFSSENDVVGATRFVADNNSSFASATGMFVGAGTLYWGSSSDGKLRVGTFAGGKVDPTTVKVVSGPGVDGKDWRSKATFILSTSTAASPLREGNVYSEQPVDPNR